MVGNWLGQKLNIGNREGKAPMGGNEYPIQFD